MQNAFILKHYFIALSKYQHATGGRPPKGYLLIVSKVA